jgi:hypothetical protein
MIFACILRLKHKRLAGRNFAQGWSINQIDKGLRPNSHIKKQSTLGCYT